MAISKPIAGLDFPDAAGFQQIIDRLKKVSGAVDDKDLFAALGLKPHSAYASFKKDIVQPKWLTTVRRKYGVSLDWLIFGTEADFYRIPIAEPKYVKDKLNIGKILGDFVLPLSWLESKGKIEDLFLMKAAGDSMEPTINRNSLTLINTALNSEQLGAIFAVAYNGNIQLHRIYTMPGKIILQSDNKRYPDVPVDLTDGKLPKTIKIVGRAVSWFHEEIL